MATGTILVVDPDPGLGELITRILAEDGYNVAVAQSVDEANELLGNGKFDLVITEAFDQHDQFDFDPEFLVTLREHAGATPIVLCSTYPSTDNVRASDYQLAAVVTKPFTIEELQQTVDNVLARSQPAHEDNSV